jgi:type I restriction enzyme S subunit
MSQHLAVENQRMRGREQTPSGSAELRIEGSTWYGSIPSDWNVDRFKRIATIRNGQVDPEDDRYKNLPLYAPNHIESGTGRLLEVESADAQGAESGKFLVESGEVVYSKIRPELRKVIVAPFKGLCSADMYPVRPTHRVESRFLYYEMLSDGFSQYTVLESDRVAMPKINRKALGECIFLYPDRKQQVRICEYLDSSCAAIDAAVAAKRRQLETLDELRKAIVQRAVTRGLSERVELQDTGNSWMESVPRGWSLVCLKRIAEIQTGLTLGKTYEGPLIERPYLRVANVQDGHLDLDDVTLIEVPATVAARVELRSGDVLMTEGGDLDKLGRGYLWHGEIEGCLHQNHVFAVRCFCHKLLPKFLTYVTASRYGRDYFEATGKRTTNLACTNGTKVGEFPIPLPLRDEQIAICAHLDAKLAEVKAIVTGIESQIDTLTAYRKSLIHECVTGQRRVTEADLNRAQNRSAGA